MFSQTNFGLSKDFLDTVKNVMETSRNITKNQLDEQVSSGAWDIEAQTDSTVSVYEKASRTRFKVKVLDESFAAASKKMEASRQRALKKAKAWMKNTGKSAEAAIKEFDLLPGDLKYLKEAMDPVGREDKDIDNDGDHDKSDKYLAKRRRAIRLARNRKTRNIETRMEETELDEAKDLNRAIYKKGKHVEYEIYPKHGKFAVAFQNLGGSGSWDYGVHATNADSPDLHNSEKDARAWIEKFHAKRYKNQEKKVKKVKISEARMEETELDEVSKDQASQHHVKVGELVNLTNIKAKPRHKVIKIEGDKVHIEKDTGQVQVFPLSRVKRVKADSYRYQQSLQKEETEELSEADMTAAIEKTQEQLNQARAYLKAANSREDVVKHMNTISRLQKQLTYQQGKKATQGIKETKETEAEINDEDGDGEKDSKKKKSKVEKCDTIDTKPTDNKTMVQTEELELHEASMSSSQKAKFDRLKKKHEGGSMQKAMRSQYGSEKGDNIFYGKLTKMAMGEEVDLNDFILDEEELELDELSKKTLGSYVKKASQDIATRAAATGRYAERANKASDDMKKSGDYSQYGQKRKDDETADKFFKKSWKRRMGVAKAVDKLTKEELELDEISDKMVNVYVSKAKRDTDASGESKRKKGIALALKKKWGGRVGGTEAPRVPTTEELELAELKLKNSEQVHSLGKEIKALEQRIAKLKLSSTKASPQADKDNMQLYKLQSMLKKKQENHRKLMSEETDLSEGPLDPVGKMQRVKIHSPGHQHHGKVADVFHKHPDGRVNAQIHLGGKRVNNITLKPHEYKPVTEETDLELDEVEAVKRGRGRPRKDAAGTGETTDSGDRHIVNQMRKAVSLNGHHVVFDNGEKKHIDRTTAQAFLNKYQGLDKPIHKDILGKSAIKSHEHFKNAMKGKVEAPKSRKVAMPALKSDVMD